MANDIDKLFHDQLHNRSFEWKEAYWEAAEAAIVAAERKRRRRFIFFWWLGGALLLAGIGLGWGLKGLTSPDSPDSKVESSVTPRAVAAEEQECPESFKETISNQLVTNAEAIEQAKRNANAKTTLDNASQQIDNEVKMINLMEAEQGEIAAPTSAEMPLLQQEALVELAFLPRILFFAKNERTISLTDLSAPTASPAIDPADRQLSWRGGLGAGVQLGGLPTEALPGLWAGGTVQGQLLEKWGWAVGIQYAVVQITPEEVGRTEQTMMGFGANLTQYLSEARSEHHLAAPIGVSYRLGKRVQLEAGAFFSYRLAVRGVVKELTYPAPWERTAQEQAEYLPRLSSYYAEQTQEFPTVERSAIYARGWLNAGREGAFRVQPYAGVQYHLGSRLSLSARVALPGTASVGAFYWLR